MKPLFLESYERQRASWPAAGRQILAQYDEDSIVVYQAYRPEIGIYAAKHGRFGEGFSFSRMTWIKPNFLWMMYRSGWGTKSEQEVTLAIRVRRRGFDCILRESVPSTFWPDRFASKEQWQAATQTSDVRLQWDPDHDPSGAPLERRAIQLGLRGRMLERFATEWIESIEDISQLVADLRHWTPSELVTPKEWVYPVPTELLSRLGMSSAVVKGDAS